MSRWHKEPWASSLTISTAPLLEDGEGQTVTFALDGASYEINLSEEHSDALRATINDYAAVARKVGGGTRRATARSRKSTTATTTSGGPSATQVRAWAKENGFEVPERGRVPAEVRNAFDAAH